MGGGHGGKPYEIPDWRIYKVDDAPELVRLKKALDSVGLKDPWLRNEVWRYLPAFKTRGERARMMLFRGAKWGILAFLVTIAGEEAYSRMYSSSKDHGHH